MRVSTHGRHQVVPCKFASDFRKTANGTLCVTCAVLQPLKGGSQEGPFSSNITPQDFDKNWQQNASHASVQLRHMARVCDREIEPNGPGLEEAHAGSKWSGASAAAQPSSARNNAISVRSCWSQGCSPRSTASAFEFSARETGMPYLFAAQHSPLKL